MSATQHEAEASREEAASSEHAAQHDPQAEQLEERCSKGKGRVCWEILTNPTAEHRKLAEERREIAAQHRAASQALKDAEASACAGLAEEDRDVSPFAYGADIRSVTQLREDRRVGKAKSMRDAGATVVFRAVPGLTAEWLRRILDCHLARNAAVGHGMPEMAYCPLVPRGVQASVRSVGDGFAVNVRADDDATAKEIWRRAQLLNAAPSQ